MLGAMIDQIAKLNWETLEAAGHDFVLVAPYAQGQSYYVCEHCSTFMITRGLGDTTIEVWHHPRKTDGSCDPHTGPSDALKAKIDALQARNVERMQNL